MKNIAESAAEAWNILKIRYSQGQALLRFLIGQKLANLYQGEMSVSDYYIQLKAIWDSLQDISKKKRCTCGVCTCGAIQIWEEENEQDKVVKFLLGLNEEFLNVRCQILTGKEIPNMDSAYSTVITEEKQRGVTHTKHNSDIGQIDTAMAVKRSSGFRSEPFNSDKYKISKKGMKLNLKFRCDHCWFYGHTKDTCYHINGYP